MYKDRVEPTFELPVPGMAMTHEVGASPWQTPPTYATVEEASEYYIERMSSDEFRAESVANDNFTVRANHCNSNSISYSIERGV